MQISELQLRQLISSLLIEGPEQDRQSLIAKYPDSEDKLKSLPVKFVSWLHDRFGDDARQEEVHPFEDAIVTVVNFAKADASIGAKWKSNEQFKKSIEEEFPKRRWAAPTDTKTMTADEMEKIIGLSQRKKQRFDVQKEDASFEDDKIGKVGPWNLWMPTTRENSCKIAQYDPVTMQPKTTWCTARTSGSNLFYNYIGGSGKDITLFYVIKDNPAGDNDWLSVGFMNGSPVLEGQDGGLSVNRANRGLTETSLKLAFGSDFNKIMSLLIQKNKQLGGKHPAAKKIEEAAQNVETFENLVNGLSKEERTDLTAKVLEQKDVSKELLMKLANDSVADVRRLVARNSSTPPEALMKLANDNTDVRRLVARNSSTPPEALMKLANDNADVRYGVAGNSSTPPEALMKLASNSDASVRRYVAENKSTPPDVLMKLASDSDISVRCGVAGNSSTPPEVLTKLASDSDYYVKQYVARNSSTPPEALTKLASDSDFDVRYYVAENSSTPPDVLMKLARGRNVDLRSAAKKALLRRGLQESLLRRIIRDVYNTL